MQADLEIFRNLTSHLGMCFRKQSVHSMAVRQYFEILQTCRCLENSVEI